MKSRGWAFWLLAALTLVFAVRAGFGFVASVSFSRARNLANFIETEHRAVPLLERAAVGELIPEARWLASQLRLGQWQKRIEEGAEPEDVGELLTRAYEDATAALAASPASGWYWMALGDLYHQAERLSAHRQGVPLSLVGQDRWAFIGRPGRIAIGMMRIGLEREPHWYPFRDQIAFVFYDYRLEEEMLEAVYRSAQVLPVYEFHEYRNLRPPEPEILDAFARGATDSLGKVPWLRPVVHRIALGRLEVRRGNWVEAEAHLRTALAEATLPLNVAEIHLQLGHALVGQGRYEEADEALAIAETEPPTEPYAVIARADLAERLDRWSEATDLWLRAKRLAPHMLQVSLRLARAAISSGQPDLAVFTLQEARRSHPRSHEPLVDLALIFIDRGDAAQARQALGELERMVPGHPSLERVRRRLARSAGGAG